MRSSTIAVTALFWILSCGSAVSHSAYKHSMETCVRPGGGCEGKMLTEAISRSRDNDLEMLESADRQSNNGRSMRARQMRLDAGEFKSDNAVNFRRN